MAIISGRTILWSNIASAQGTKVLQANPKRAGLYIEVVSGTGNVAFDFENPGIAVTGGQAGIILAQGESYSEAPPNVNTGAVYVISANADEDIRVREDTFLE